MRPAGSGIRENSARDGDLHQTRGEKQQSVFNGFDQGRSNPSTGTSGNLHKPGPELEPGKPEHSKACSNGCDGSDDGSQLPPIPAGSWQQKSTTRWQSSRTSLKILL
jgi:hypothetical protein